MIFSVADIGACAYEHAGKNGDEAEGVFEEVVPEIGFFGGFRGWVFGGFKFNF